jgi:hypothetical protein
MPDRIALSRRELLVGTATLALGARSLASPAPAPRKLHEFPYSQIALTAGPLADHYRRTHAHFLTLDEDRILKVYRQRAGLPAPGLDMGGWYDADGFVPGHLIGQFISGLSRIHAHTADPAAAAKARRLVEGYSACFAKDHNPFASPKASTTWPCYILDKYEVGLLDAATFAASDEARRLLPRIIEAALPFIPDHVYDRGPNSPKQAPYDEPYILPENLFNAHSLTGDRRYLDLARTYLLDRDYFDPLAANRNVLPGKHGYSHVIALSSGAKAYEVLGDPKYLRALENAWQMLDQTQEYASGAWAPKEVFVEPHSGGLGASLTTTHDHFETPCGYYAHSKLARYLLGFTADARYGDGLERVLYNTILGALDPDDDGGYFYYSDYHAEARKGYYQRKWPCCAGTLVQSVADYPLNIYFFDNSGIYVNLYVASEVRWHAKGAPVKLVQNTAYPESESVELHLELPASARFALNLRIPAWLRGSAEIRINGKSTAVEARPGTFARIERRWKNHDTVALTLPFSFRTVPIDDRNPDTVAVMRGPIMLAAIDPPPQLAATRAQLTNMQPVAATALAFTCATSTGPVRMRPFYQVRRETYSTYFHQSTEA